MNDSGTPLKLASIPLFPLPNVVLFPRAILPLHIFEERYKQMTADALVGDKLIALALLKRGWEKDYYAAPPIEPVVCVGRIVSWERLPDGRYNFLLEGMARATVRRERGHKRYRRADLQELPDLPALEIDLEEPRAELSRLLDGPLARLPISREFRRLLDSDITTPVAADLLAFHLLEDVGVKQELLSLADARRRVERLLDVMRELGASLRDAQFDRDVDARWN